MLEPSSNVVAGRLGLSRRQVERLVARYRELGAAGLGLALRKRGCRVDRRLDENTACRVQAIVAGWKLPRRMSLYRSVSVTVIA